MNHQEQATRYPMLAEILAMRNLPFQPSYTMRSAGQVFGVTGRAMPNRVSSGQIVARDYPAAPGFSTRTSKTFWNPAAGKTPIPIGRPGTSDPRRLPFCSAPFDISLYSTTTKQKAPILRADSKCFALDMHFRAGVRIQPRKGNRFSDLPKLTCCRSRRRTHSTT